ncbi:penicillin-binding protein 1A [Citrobacter freundii]|nr:penicillin-binding protein 1A [Citrobacter freundii]
MQYVASCWGAGSIYGLYRYIEPQLPDVATLKDVRLQIPMQVYSADGELIAQYGEKRRIPVTLDQMPPVMVKSLYRHRRQSLL